MRPIAPLMIEHRLIERVIDILKDELSTIRNNENFNPVFIDTIVDFIRTYADQTHHGKEEDILFRELKKKKLTKEHEKIMNELIQEHVFARKTTKELLEAKEQYLQNNKIAINTIIEKMNILAEFYPKHIEKEDKHFFIPIMDYFTKEEQDAILEEGHLFDRKMIHRKYDQLATNFEKKRNIKRKKTKSNWIDYV